MVRPNQEAIDTFITITGVTESVALQKLEEHGGDLNAAVNAFFGEGDRNTSTNTVRQTSILTPQDDFMEIDDPIESGSRAAPFPLLSAASHGMVIVDEVDEDTPVTMTAPATLRNDGSDERHSSPTAPAFENLPEYNDEIEEEMVRAAIEASKREVEDLSDFRTKDGQTHMEDANLAHAVSLSLMTAEKEKALLQLGGDIEASKAGSSQPAEVDPGKVPVSNGRLEAGSSSIQDEGEDVEDQPLVRQRPRHMSSGSVELPKETQVTEASSPSNPQQHDISDLPQHSGNVFPDEWGGISSEEHDEAVMLEAAMFGGIPERGYNYSYAPHQFMRPHGSFAQRTPRPPSPSLEAQRLIREQQDDEYLASLLADREKESKVTEEAKARRLEEEEARKAALEEEKRKEEETCRKMEEEKEYERQLAAKEASLPQEPSADDENAVTLLVKMPDGSRRGRRFLKSDKLQSLFDFIDIGRGFKAGTYRLVRPYPRRAFSDSESGLTLNDLGLTSRQEALFLELI